MGLELKTVIKDLLLILKGTNSQLMKAGNLYGRLNDGCRILKVITSSSLKTLLILPKYPF